MSELQPIERLWTPADVMAFLGVKRTFVYEHTRSGDIPSMNVGGLLRYDPAKVRAWAASQARGDAKVLPFR